MSEPTRVTFRGTILERAKELTEGDRNQSYGSPEPNLGCFSDMVHAYLVGKASNAPKTELKNLNAVDGAIIMVLAKISRVAANQNHPDNYIDMAAYAAIAGECAHIYNSAVQAKEGGQ